MNIKGIEPTRSRGQRRASMAWKLHAIELRRQRRADGVGRPTFDFSQAPRKIKKVKREAICRNSSFHVHHWYWSWLVGMHANHDAWWSQAAGAFLWGGYINGIAAWGRDDVLGCERSLYAAVDQGCPFVSTRRLAAADVSAPDWRTCSPAPR